MTLCPLSSVYSPKMIRMSVVFPAPFGPTSATRSPGETVHVMSEKRVRAPIE
jgi:hypothetical protein